MCIAAETVGLLGVGNKKRRLPVCTGKDAVVWMMRTAVGPNIGTELSRSLRCARTGMDCNPRANVRTGKAIAVTSRKSTHWRMHAQNAAMGLHQQGAVMHYDGAVRHSSSPVTGSTGAQSCPSKRTLRRLSVSGNAMPSMQAACRYVAIRCTSASHASLAALVGSGNQLQRRNWRRKPRPSDNHGKLTSPPAWKRSRPSVATSSFGTRQASMRCGGRPMASGAASHATASRRFRGSSSHQQASSTAAVNATAV